MSRAKYFKSLEVSGYGYEVRDCEDGVEIHKECNELAVIKFNENKKCFEAIINEDEDEIIEVTKDLSKVVKALDDLIDELLEENSYVNDDGETIGRKEFEK